MADSMAPCKMLWADPCCYGNEIWARRGDPVAYRLFSKSLSRVSALSRAKCLLPKPAGASNDMMTVLQNEPAVNSHGASDSVTSAEFDRFLTERVREAERMPSISSGTTAGQTSGVGVTSQPPADGELFSL